MSDEERKAAGGEDGGHGGHKSHAGGHKSHGPPHGGHGDEEHAGAPEWLISFADNVTLMMGFFVILLSLNLRPPDSANGSGAGGVPSPETLDWALAVREAFNNPVDINSTDPRDALLVQRLLVRSGKGPALEPGPRGRNERTHSIRPTDYYGQGGVVPFVANSAELASDTTATAREIAKHLRGFTAVIEVRGHASASEAHAGNGMLLSYQRAAAVAEVLAGEGIEWRRLRLIACGAGEPLVSPAYDAAQEQLNRRVEVIVTHEGAGSEETKNAESTEDADAGTAEGAENAEDATDARDAEDTTSMTGGEGGTAEPEPGAEAPGPSEPKVPPSESGREAPAGVPPSEPEAPTRDNGATS